MSLAYKLKTFGPHFYPELEAYNSVDSLKNRLIFKAKYVPNNLDYFLLGYVYDEEKQDIEESYEEGSQRGAWREIYGLELLKKCHEEENKILEEIVKMDKARSVLQDHFWARIGSLDEECKLCKPDYSCCEKFSHIYNERKEEDDEYVYSGRGICRNRLCYRFHCEYCSVPAENVFYTDKGHMLSTMPCICPLKRKLLVKVSWEFRNFADQIVADCSLQNNEEYLEYKKQHYRVRV